MPNFLDITGERYGRLLVLREAGRQSIKPHGWMFLCQCDCGKQVIVASSGLRRKIHSTKSCGCFRTEMAGRLGRETAHKTRHGKAKRGSQAGIYSSWLGMIQRCTNPKTKAFKNYGGRGITVCERWLTFENFLADMGERPIGRTLDRKNNDGNYEPSNCRWATRDEQSANQRSHGRQKIAPSPTMIA